jgi:hypothetical protein
MATSANGRAAAANGAPAGVSSGRGETSPPPPLTALELRLAELNGNPAVCTRSVGREGRGERCAAFAVGNGAGIVVRLGAAGGQGWVQSYLLRLDGGPAELLTHADGGGIAFDPTLSFYVMDAPLRAPRDDVAHRRPAPEPGLIKVVRGAGAPQPFAACTSPVLSPGDGWFVCRNRYGDALRVPVNGGALELFAPNPNDYPAVRSAERPTDPNAVRFDSPGELVFERGPDDETRVPWTEGPVPAVPRVGAPAPDLPAGYELSRARPLFCDNWGETLPPSLAPFCSEPAQMSLPALSRDGHTLVALASATPCCADVMHDEVLWYGLPGPRSPRDRTLLFGWDPAPDLTASGKVTEERVRALAIRMAELEMQRLTPLPLPPGSLFGGAWPVEVERGKVLVLGSTVVRLLREGQVTYTHELPPFHRLGPCCGAEPNADGSWTGVPGCDAPARTIGAWYSEPRRLLVLELKNDDGADWCEDGPAFETMYVP